MPPFTSLFSKKKHIKPKEQMIMDKGLADEELYEEHIPTPPNKLRNSVLDSAMAMSDFGAPESDDPFEEQNEDSPVITSARGELIRSNDPREEAGATILKMDNGILRYKDIFVYCFLLPQKNDTHTKFSDLYLHKNSKSSKVKYLQDKYKVSVRLSTEQILFKGHTHQCCFIFGNSIDSVHKALSIIQSTVPEVYHAKSDVQLDHHNERAYIHQNNTSASVLKKWAASDKNLANLLFWYRQSNGMPNSAINLANDPDVIYSQEEIQSTYMREEQEMHGAALLLMDKKGSKWVVRKNNPNMASHKIEATPDVMTTTESYGIHDQWEYGEEDGFEYCSAYRGPGLGRGGPGRRSKVNQSPGVIINPGDPGYQERENVKTKTEQKPIRTQGPLPTIDPGDPTMQVNAPRKKVTDLKPTRTEGAHGEIELEQIEVDKDVKNRETKEVKSIVQKANTRAAAPKNTQSQNPAVTARTGGVNAAAIQEALEDAKRKKVKTAK